MRSTMFAGIEFGSPERKRWPLISTSVRGEPKPRRPIEEPPVPPALLTCGLVFGPVTAGSCWTRSPKVSLPVFWIAARSMVMTGLDVSMSTRRMFEPVTVMVSSC